MKLLRQIFIIIFSLIIIAFGIKFYRQNNPSTVQAIGGDLTIDWGVLPDKPIFEIINFYPGQTEEREVKITNNALTQRPVSVRGIETEDLDNLSNVLDLTISQNGTVLYDQTLSKFFTDSALPDGIFLFDLNPGEEKTVKFTVKFKESAGNIYQNKKIIFDLKIGLSIPVPAECQGIKFKNVIFGTEHDDILRGGNGPDLIFGLEGNDQIYGSNNHDCLVGGLGNDKIDGSNDKDVIFGNEGNDKINGSNGNDLIFGGEENDSIDGSNGDDKIYGEGGNDTINGGNGDDKIFGSLGDDKLSGGNGDDHIEGNEGNDILTGDNGNDLLLGGNGFDSANGGLGTDRCEAETKIKCER